MYASARYDDPAREPTTEDSSYLGTSRLLVEGATERARTFLEENR